MAATELGPRQLNRALLARQLLLERSPLGPVAAVEHLVGLQAQATLPPYLALWSRLAGFAPADLSRLLDDREVVRLALMRSTIHLVSARDALALRPVLAEALVKALRSQRGSQLDDADVDAVAAAGRALVEAEPMTLAEVAEQLALRWPDLDAPTIAAAVRTHVPLVQPPPRGLWGRSGLARHTSLESWLGRPLDEDASPDRTVVRYLAAFGPASAKDVQAWSGLTGVRGVLERLRPSLVEFRDLRGVELFDLPDAPRPDADAVAPVRFLPEYDNLLLSHADRTRVISEDDRRRIGSSNGHYLSTVLVDGFVRASWRVEHRSGTAVLLVEPFARITGADRAGMEAEGTALLEVLAPDAPLRDVRVGAAP